MRGRITAPGEVRVEFDAPLLIDGIPVSDYSPALDNVLAAIRANTLAHEAEQAQNEQTRPITGEMGDD